MTLTSSEKQSGQTVEKVAPTFIVISSRSVEKGITCIQIIVSDPVMSVTAFFLLCCLAITAQAQSCSKPVGGADMNLKGEAILQDSFPDGSKVSFACNPGYTSAGGSATITCTAGSWSTLRLVCERKSCGAFLGVDNANVEYPSGDTLFGDTAEVTCNPGYMLVGNKVIRCGVQGWMDRPPVCEVVKCPTPGAIGNGSFTPQNENYNYREVVRYSCNTGFELNGSRESVCSEDKKFHPQPPNCVWVECKDPVIQNAVFVDGSRPPHKYLSLVTYRCKTGYVMIGQPTIKCNISSQWSPEVPKCQAGTKPPIITTTTAKTPTASPTPTTDGGNKSRNDTGIIVGVVSAAVIMVQHYWV
ncbi:membrane cofactor protein isoform X3 [Austrofundulus limnaeus]|uniref:Membrane cofactor protein isoform X3 n=1 Tax=Austrofundulus limnaeus TaxID=52670 RepID=A0A2I4CE09_AUSLI|nr:PREDICTED: membrane cofactor protein-like isoform X3 [Austrofundulus limnaeus]